MILKSNAKQQIKIQCYNVNVKFWLKLKESKMEMKKLGIWLEKYLKKNELR